MLKNPCLALALVLALALSMTGFATVAQAAILVQSDIYDYEAYLRVPALTEDISQGIGDDHRIGGRTSATSSSGITLASSVLPFALPDLTGQVMDSATLTVTFEGESGTLRPGSAGAESANKNIDLYGLGIDAASPITQDASRQFSGANDTTNATKLQDDFFTVAENPLAGETFVKVSVDISAYLHSLYDNGATPGQFVILRLSYDSDTITGRERYRILASDGDGSTIDTGDPGPDHTIETGAPFLTINTSPLPEPGAMALLALFAAPMIRRQR